MKDVWKKLAGTGIVAACVSFSLIISDICAGQTADALQEKQHAGIQYERLAIVEKEQVLANSQRSKEYTEAAIKEYQPKLKKLAERRDILNLNKNKLEKSSLIMTAEERTKEEAALQKEESAIIDALNQLRAKKKQEDEQMFEHLELYFDQAVKRVSEAKKLSLVINKHALFYYKDVLDITAEVTREFDHLIKKAETKHSQQNNSSAENDKPEKAKP